MRHLLLSNNAQLAIGASWRIGPSLDLNFADTKSLIDSVSGKSLITFTRASGGTYVDSQGVIRNATTNLLLRSEEFDNASWTKNDGPTVTANQIAAPNGTQTADQLVGNGSVTGYLEQAVPIVNGLSYTFSVYLKRRNTSTVNTLLYGSQFNSGGANLVATWNLDTGNASFTNGASGSMIAVGSGWYRCVMTATATTTNANSPNQLVRLVGNSGDCYLWGAQLEQSSTVGEYIPTGATINSAPRFDHDPTTLESLGLLIEENRSNLLSESQNFVSTVWTRLNINKLGNTAISPAGDLTADTLREDSTSGFHEVYRSSFPAGTYTASCFFKQDAGTRLANLSVSAGPINWISVKLNLNTGVQSSIYRQDGTGGFVGTPTASVVAYPNGWYRLTLSFQATLAFAVQIAMANTDVAPTDGNFGLDSYTGDNTSGFFVWGAQLELGDFPTSYIPTFASTATRTDDIVSITGKNFTSWYRQDEGTVLAAFKPRSVLTAGVVYLNNGTVNEATRIFYNSAISNYAVSVRALGVEQSNIFGLGPVASQNERIAAAYKLNDLAATRNGAAPTIDTSVTIPYAINKLDIGTTQASNFLNGTLKRLTYWPVRLDNPALQRITL